MKMVPNELWATISKDTVNIKTKGVSGGESGNVG